MRKTIAALFTVITLFSMLPLFSLTASAAGTNYAQGWNGDTSKCIAEDNYGLFADEPELLDELNDCVKQYSEKLEMNIYILIAGSDYRMSDDATEDFCGEKYDEIFGQDTDGVFFFLDLSGKKPAYDYLSTSGKAVVWYQDIIDPLLDPLYEHLPPSSVDNYVDYRRDIAVGLVKLMQCFESCTHRHESDSYYYYGSDTGRYVYFNKGELYVTDSKPPVIYRRSALIALIAALVSGGLTNLISFFSTKSKYKLKEKTDARIYTGNHAPSYANNSDVFIRTYTTKTRIQSNSGGGGGGHRSGGGHHSGGTHGGGGRHR